MKEELKYEYDHCRGCEYYNKPYLSVVSPCDSCLRIYNTCGCITTTTTTTTKTNNDITTELLPCPFCGGEAILNIIPPHTHTIATFMPDCEGEAFIECTECTCILAGRTAEEVIEAWNSR